jgi:ABC-2 type transport system permease protein
MGDEKGMISYLHVFLTFARNSLVRDMTFRMNFLIDLVSSIGWVCINLAFYSLLFHYTPALGAHTGWHEYEFFVFLGTALLINSVVQALVMTNADDLSELVRTGGLDFVLLKPMDAQFLVSFVRFDWSSMGNVALGAGVAIYGLARLHYLPGAMELALYLLYVGCGIAIYYSLMIALAATSVWLGRNQSLLDFWFYLTNFSRYPMEIYRGPWGTPLRVAFTFCVPVLIAVNVPARILVRLPRPGTVEAGATLYRFLPAFALLATAGCLLVSRWIFQRALQSYRSASS